MHPTDPQQSQLVIDLLGLFCNWLTSIIMMVATIAAFLSAKAASNAANANRQNTQTQIMGSLLTEYSQPQMLADIRLLYTWKKDYEDKFAEEFGKIWREDYEKIELQDRARRHLAHYFEKVYVLLKNNLINDNLARDILSKGQIETMRNVIEPLEEAINSAYEHQIFDRLGSLYALPKRKIPVESLSNDEFRQISS